MSDPIDDSIGDPFLDHVVVTSAHTQVNTDDLTFRCSDMRQAQDILLRAVGSIQSAREKISALNSGYYEEYCSETALENAILDVTQCARDIEVFQGNLLRALLIFIAAEGDAARFECVWKKFGPQQPSTWNVGTFSPHTGQNNIPTGAPIGSDQAQSMRGNSPFSPFLCTDHVRMWLAGGLLWGTGTINSLIHHASEFATGVGDGSVGLRAELDMAAIGRRIDYDTAYFVPPGRHEGSYVGNREIASAAALAASWYAGLGALFSGPSYGVRVSTGRGAHNKASQTRWVGSGDGSVPVALTYVPGTGAMFPLLSVIAGASDSGAGLPASVELRKPGPVGRDPVTVKTPRQATDALRRIATLKEGSDTGQIEVLEHRGLSGKKSWSVIVRGTQKWLPGESNPQDMLSNLQAVAGQNSDQRQAVLTAMDMAGIRSGDPVEFVGHSQAGIIVGQLASEPDVLRRYHVVSALAVGSPTGGVIPGEGVRMLALENTRDIVPSLDGTANHWNEGSATLHFDGQALDGRTLDGKPVFAHDLSVYVEALEHCERESHGSRAPVEVQEWLDARQKNLNFTDDTVTISHIFDTQRIRPST
ncbi:hypothetical protein [Schaalia sp. lx-100]|uniref:hypothetical protein n=1 Tax=Schaalia sp. lx-100 TaxID=2899081 RepID=UPI001E377334|nr:hypothetical protein [Schaalia sp. lx-100]MCD4557793.1 hypothetical protein [Schaalia sp. lx-100]